MKRWIMGLAFGILGVLALSGCHGWWHCRPC